MSRLMIIGPGELGGAVLEAAARSGRFDSIAVASRSAPRAAAKANNARVGAALEGRYPSIEAVELHAGRDDAPRRLREFEPDVVLAAPSLFPWWAARRLDRRLRELADAVPFGGFLACHLAPMLEMRALWDASGLRCPWVGASYPDVVNHVLRCTGAAPDCGVGNVAEAVPKVRLALAAGTGLAPADIEVRLVAQHAFEYFVYGSGAAGPRPPFLVDARGGGRDLSPAAREAVFSPMPIPYGLEFNRLTASAALGVLAALADPAEGAARTHVPAPAGRLGGYPVRLEERAIHLDLAPGWTELQADAVNRASLPWDGIEAVAPDGEVRFTEATVQALGALTGNPVRRLAPTDAGAMAAELLAALGGG